MCLIKTHRFPKISRKPIKCYKRVNYLSDEKCEGWVNLYRNDSGGIRAGSELYFSKENATEIGKHSTRYVTTAKIEWEE